MPALQRIGITAIFVLALSALLSVPALADYTVTGRFQYEDRDFNLSGFTGVKTNRPIRFADIRIVAGNGTLAAGATDANGQFTITVPGSTAQAISALCVTSATNTSGLQLEVRVALSTTLPGDFYAVSSASSNASGSAPVDLGTTTAPSNIDVGKAFNIWDVAIDWEQFVNSPNVNGTLPTSKVTIIWASNQTRTGSFFSSGVNKQIYVGVTAAYNDTVIAHEFGHYIDNTFSKSANPGGAHFLGDDNQDIRLSWGEGLATFLGSSSREFKGYARPEIYVDTDGASLNFSYEVETLTGDVSLGSKTGTTNEVAVTAVLWDITDGPNTADATPGTDDDSLQRPFSDVWKVLTKYLTVAPNLGTISVEDFWNGWFSPGINNGALPEMQTVFATLNGMEFIADAAEPDNSAGSANLTAAAQVPQLVSGAKVVISEVDLGSTDSVELYNAGNTDADLTGWRLVARAPGSSTATFLIPQFKLPAGGFVLLREDTGANTNSVLFFGSNISWSNGEDGSCALTDSGGTGKDFVRWGNSSDPSPAGTSFNAPNPASPPAGKNLARVLGGSDTDSGSDFSSQIPTPGTYNVSGQEKHHTFYPAGDVDFASFNAIAGRSYLIESLNLKSGADTMIDLLSTDGNSVLASNDDIGGTKASRVSWTAQSPGTYFVRVRRYDGQSNFSNYGSYDLRVISSTSNLGGGASTGLTVSFSGQGGRFTTISSAVGAASDGDTIEILDNGTYAESITVSGKSLTLKAARGKNPIIDGRNTTTQATLNISNTKSMRVEGLTILGGARGIRVSGGATATIVNTVVYKAFDPLGFSDGIQVSGTGSSARIIQCTIVNNGRLGIGVFSGGFAKISNSIIKGNAGSDISGDATFSATISHCLSATGNTSGLKNFDGDPKFVDPANDDYRLTAGSAAIDMGDPIDVDVPATDASGIPRSLDGDGNGTALPDIGAYEYLRPGSLSSTAIFPQIVAGAIDASRAYRTSIIGVNTGSVAATVNVQLTKSDGNPFPVTVINKAGSFFDFSIPPNGTARLETSVSGGTIAGYAKILSSVPINGSALFKVVSGSNIISEAGVGLSKPTKSFTVYIDNTNNANSGYAVANSGTSVASLTLTLRDKDGIIKETKPLTLPAGQHFGKFASQDFPTNGAAGFEGSIEFSSDQNVSAVALRYDNTAADVFSTIPVLVDEASTTLYFPQVADGLFGTSTYRTNFVLVNPSASATAAKLEFFSDDGSLLSLPIGGLLKTSHDVPISAHGTARFLTDATSAVGKFGWVRVTCPVAIGGSSIFQTVVGTRITSEAGVSASLLSTHFTTYVESLGFAESGLALCNPNNSSITVTLKLRDSAGAEVNTTNFTLAPFGHIAKFFTQWFNGVTEFEGTLEVIATGSVSGVALRYDNASANVFATLPVIVIP